MRDADFLNYFLLRNVLSARQNNNTFSCEKRSGSTGSSFKVESGRI